LYQGKKSYVAFKLHPQEGSLGPAAGPGAVERSTEPQMAAELWLGRYLEIPVNKSGGLLSF